MSATRNRPNGSAKLAEGSAQAAVVQGSADSSIPAPSRTSRINRR
ncbi:hypothetical protein [Saccharothrix sp. NRRL B-16348]|nr:hypothetical protein [Saccharothrix sp. NRRL B-16348]